MWESVEKVAKSGEKWGRMWITVEKGGYPVEFSGPDLAP
jgi:hypothetical protein